MSAIRPGLQAFSSAFNRIAMKKLLYILAGLGLAACTSDIEELPEVGPQPGREVTLTGISGTASRTQFVPGDGTEIQFQWSTGDRIWAGGVQSAEAGTDGNVADFGFTNLPGAAPYRIYYNMTGTDAEAVVPTEQRQAEPGKLQLGPNGDFGYATTDSEGRFTLSHATAYVWFNPWSQDVKEKLVSVTLAATDASTVLTGTRTFDGTGFSDATDANNAVTLSFGKEGVELPATSSTASVFAAAVVYPADCSAEEIHVTYTFADGSVYTETKTGRNFEAGRIYRLTTEIAKRDGGSLEIQGLEDSDEPVCMKYGASEAYALTAGGWIPTVEMTSAPAGWTADFDIARRSLLIAPPAEYTDGMDLENTVTIRSDGKPILSQEYYVLDFTHPEGTFVLIEGNMTSENGTIVYFDQHMRYHEKVYEEINDNEIGNVLQDMYLANGKIYFITQNGKTSSMGTTFNGDGRFVVCDAHTMKRLVARDMQFYANVDTSTGATQSSKSTLCWPQHIVVVSPEKAYIQYSTADNESHSGIRIVDLQTNIIRTSDIPGTFGAFTKTGATKARMVFSRGKVFAGRGNSVIVLDPATDAVIKTVTYENRQVKDLAKGYDGKIYAIFTGEFTGNSGMTGAASFTKPAMIVALDANGEVVSETNLPEQIELRTENEDGSDEMTIEVEVVDALAVSVTAVPIGRKYDGLTRTVSLDRTITLRPFIWNGTNPKFSWTIDGQEVGTELSYTYTPTETGIKKIVFTVTDTTDEPEMTLSKCITRTNETRATLEFTVECHSEEESHRRPASGASSATWDRVYEYTPAPGQFINELVSGGFTGTETSPEAAVAYAEERMKKNTWVSLGGWGGYIVVGFDHSIDNSSSGYKGGYNFSITGNAFKGSSEPGIVYVMQDTNGNTLPDDEWYELKGSEYGKEETVQDYAVTYYRPTYSGADVQWKDNQGVKGKIDYLKQYHDQPSYYPAWIGTDSYTLYGPCLKSRTYDQSGNGSYWVNGEYDWGYADNFGNDRLSEDDNAAAGAMKVYFKISNAVDKNGQPANLKYIDFIRVQTGVNAKAGWLGENSTEVFGFTDENINQGK